jgi:hypothetical protein
LVKQIQADILAAKNSEIAVERWCPQKVF